MTFDVKVTIESVKDAVHSEEWVKWCEVSGNIKIFEEGINNRFAFDVNQEFLNQGITQGICTLLTELSTRSYLQSGIDWFAYNYKVGADTKYTIPNEAFLEIEIDTQDIDFSSFAQEFFKKVRLFNLSVHVSDEVQVKNMEDCFYKPIIVNARG